MAFDVANLIQFVNRRKGWQTPDWKLDWFIG